MKTLYLNTFALILASAAITLLVTRNLSGDPAHQLLNVSYDPTRELYQDLDRTFIADYEKQAGLRLTIKQSHGGSSRQAKDVVAGTLDADVVTLALPG